MHTQFLFMFLKGNKSPTIVKQIISNKVIWRSISKKWNNIINRSFTKKLYWYTSVIIRFLISVSFTYSSSKGQGYISIFFDIYQVVNLIVFPPKCPRVVLILWLQIYIALRQIFVISWHKYIHFTILHEINFLAMFNIWYEMIFFIIARWFIIIWITLQNSIVV